MKTLDHLYPNRLTVRLVRLLAVLFVVAMLFVAVAQAADISAKAMTSWTLPTMALDGSPLAGDQALTETQVFVSLAPIADAAIMTPTAKLAANAAAYTWAGTMPNGGTIYVRVKACNAGGCSAYSAQGSKAFALSAPGAPGQVNITVTFSVPGP